jgi:hypothetical protein
MKRKMLRLREKVMTQFARLKKDESGNVMILYVAAALLLVGMLWAIIGTGARMVQKETIQSSADAAAFSAAVIKAKGLNIIAFCNLVMALLLAVLMLLRLIKGALMIMWGICLAACFDIWGGEVLCAFAPEAGSLYNEYSQLLSQIEPRIMDAMRGLAKVERAVDKTFPALSLAEAYRVGTADVYKANFGKGSLLTVTWPLPVGEDMHLPTKDGTWNELCDQAAQTFQRVLDVALQKIGLPSFVAGIFGDAVYGLLQPLKGVLCGSGGGSSTTMIDTTETKTNCADCSGASGARFTGTKITRNGAGAITSTTPGVCKLDYFDSGMCPTASGTTFCSNGDEYQNLTFESCEVKTKKPYDVGGDVSGDKPKPLDLADDWTSRTNVRAFTVLTDAQVAQRRQSVGIASKDKGSAPALNQLMGMAQAEFFQQNGATDLWHMDWRARLVRFTFGNTSGSDTGGATGVPADGASVVQSALSGMNDVMSTLGDQFLLH